ncbi:MAG: hypothetical protein MZV49_04685 [Rhodopseudomonas palustris]|nr:hypothetical protein [Rhodopseudomonas palustris]
MRTFIFNGTERVEANQLNRSPGAGAKYGNEEAAIKLQIAPYRGGMDRV